jgi:hypothetical protein
MMIKVTPLSDAPFRHSLAIMANRTFKNTGILETECGARFLRYAKLRSVELGH